MFPPLNSDESETTTENESDYLMENSIGNSHFPHVSSFKRFIKCNRWLLKESHFFLFALVGNDLTSEIRCVKKSLQVKC